jgi:segregation and condensation protein B
MPEQSQLKPGIDVAILCSLRFKGSIDVRRLASCIGEPLEAIEAVLQELAHDLEGPRHSFDLDRYLFRQRSMVRAKFKPLHKTLVERFLEVDTQKEAQYPTVGLSPGVGQDYRKAQVEALLFAASRSMKVFDLVRHLGGRVQELEGYLREIESDLIGSDRGIQLRRRGSTVRISVKTSCEALVGKIFPERQLKPLTQQAIETLAVIALKQPITTQGIAKARGVFAGSATVRSLARRRLIGYTRISGELHWRVTQVFLDQFNLLSLDQLYDPKVYGKTFPSLSDNLYR